MGSERESRSARSVNIKISDEVQRGVYANKLIVSHLRDEFILDFVADFPPGPNIVARVLTSPAHVRAVIDALSTNLGRYERRHGAVRRSPPPAPPADA
ncbi:MAG: DUF3467 domain-containing protein [Acidobacteriota bacterium]|nr:DUF3467 domain-containing protein [Acidobacteriota bacterium]